MKTNKKKPQLAISYWAVFRQNHKWPQTMHNFMPLFTNGWWARHHELTPPGICDVVIHKHVNSKMGESGGQILFRSSSHKNLGGLPSLLTTESRAKARLFLLSEQVCASRSGPKSFMIGSPNYPEASGGLLFQNVSGHTLRLRLGLCQSSGGQGSPSTCGPTFS